MKTGNTAGGKDEETEDDDGDGDPELQRQCGKKRRKTQTLGGREETNDGRKGEKRLRS